jgi:hypothetical protein
LINQVNTNIETTTPTATVIKLILLISRVDSKNSTGA